MSHLLFVLYLLTGKIERSGEYYTVHLTTSEHIDYACKGEIINWIDTGTFKYDDFLCK